MTDPTSRMLILLSHLESRGTWTGTALAEQLGVSPRTLRRDIDRLRSLGYVVDADAGPGGGYALGRGQVLPPLPLDAEQALVVALALLRLANLNDRKVSETALAALSRIESLMPTEVRERLAVLDHSTSFVSDGAEVGTLLQCSDAIRRQLRVEFSYTDRHGELSMRRVEPHRLVVRHRSWLLLAFDLNREAWRAFRVDRISSLRIGTWHFSQREGVDAELARLELPIPASAWKHSVTAKISVPRDEVVKALPHLAHYVEETGPSTTLFSAGVGHPAEAACWLSSIPFPFTVLGDDAVIAAVEELQQRLHAAIRPAAG